MTTDPQTRALLREVAREAAREAVDDALTRLGFDVSDPTEAQADMQAVRNWRHAQEKVKAMTMRAVITVLVTGAMAAVWLAVKDKFLGG